MDRNMDNTDRYIAGELDNPPPPPHHAPSLTFREDRVALIFLCSGSRLSKTRDHARGR